MLLLYVRVSCQQDFAPSEIIPGHPGTSDCMSPSGKTEVSDSGLVNMRSARCPDIPGYPSPRHCAAKVSRKLGRWEKLGA